MEKRIVGLVELDLLRSLSEATVDAVTNIGEQLICSIALGRINGNYGGTAPSGSGYVGNPLINIYTTKLKRKDEPVDVLQYCGAEEFVTDRKAVWFIIDCYLKWVTTKIYFVICIRITSLVNQHKGNGKVKQQPKKIWISENTVALMEKHEYNRFTNLVNREARKDREVWLGRYGREIEEQLNKENIEQKYKLLNKFSRKAKTKNGIVKSKEETTPSEDEEIADRWQQYLEELVKNFRTSLYFIDTIFCI
ncbi:hypothetical protein FQA39_LY16196 [Lamprigera yunnana]|nr:hypothetical protein FQA39_LY16196 [Lamprigera yunnana]